MVVPFFCLRDRDFENAYADLTILLWLLSAGQVHMLSKNHRVLLCQGVLSHSLNFSWKTDQSTVFCCLQGFTLTNEGLLRSSLQCLVVKEDRPGARVHLEDCIIGPKDKWTHPKVDTRYVAGLLVERRLH